ncbi:MAG TPA: amidohydrolase [Pyrinomonadaceae bacterium]|nr:amidohydrolase [Chloracidobacterium sp.]HRJ88793.1 amidohydrolase [Pyrinomonadaceae bacterium]HRK48934.1 amidohydrolase [Pyrinomonadaceae bacterium]
MRPIKPFFALILISLISANGSGQAAARAKADLIIVGGTVVTMDKDRRVIENGGIAIRQDKLLAVGTRAEIERGYYAATVTNATGSVVIPGLINTHTHVPMTLFRGIADDMDLQEWLTKFIFPAEAKNVNEAFVRAGTRLGLAEMIRGGTTTFCDMYYFEDAIAEETKKAGMRGVLGETVLDFPAPDNKTFAEGLEYTERFIKRWQGDPLIVPAIAPHAPYTVSEDNLTQARAMSDRLRAPLVIHLAEANTETEFIQQKHEGMRPIEFMQKIAFFNDRTIAAHVIQANAAELDILKRYNVGIAHNPQSNMKLAAGVAPVPLMLQKGLSVGLGTDGPASNNDLSLWEEMDTAAKLHKLHLGDPKVLTAEQAFTMATIGGARALHLGDLIGSLEAGKRADIAIVDFSGLHQTPFFNVYSHLVYATKASDVSSVIINGRIVMQNRRLLTLNENAIKQEAITYRNKIIESLKN